MAQLYSPEGEEIVVVDMGNGNEAENIRISRSAYSGNLEDWFTASAFGMPPMDDMDINGYAAKAMVFEDEMGSFLILAVATGEEIIIIEGPISLEEGVLIMESLLP